MDPQLQELAQHIADDVVKRIDGVVVNRLGETEKRLGGVIGERLDEAKAHLDGVIGKRLDEAEKRLSQAARVHMEELKSQIKLLGEGYVATWESIDRRLERLGEKVDNGFRDHAHLLTNHEKRITALERRR